MGKFLILYLALLIFTQCSSLKPGKVFFDYDEIDHYSIDLPEEKTVDLFRNKSRSAFDSLKMEVILGSIPKDMSDLSFIKKLGKIGFAKRSVAQSKFQAIDKIFVEKWVYESLATTCIYVYRDILIFKKNHKVIGTAKICFECGAHEIVGTDAKTENFGQEGDYAKLRRLLNGVQ